MSLKKTSKFCNDNSLIIGLIKGVVLINEGGYMHVCIRTAVKPIKKSVKIIEFNTVSTSELRQSKSIPKEGQACLCRQLLNGWEF